MREEFEVDKTDRIMTKTEVLKRLTECKIEVERLQSHCNDVDREFSTSTSVIKAILEDLHIQHALSL